MRALLLTVVASAVAACGSADATSPSPAAVGYEGRWTGRVLASINSSNQASPFDGAFSFTVSRQQTITAIEFDYRLNGCSGRVPLAGLAVPIVEVSGFGPTFEYRSTDFTQPNYVTVFGKLGPNGTADGYIGFGQYAGCGDGGGSWTARR